MEGLTLEAALHEVAAFLCTASAPRITWSLADTERADQTTAATLARLREATAVRCEVLPYATI